MTSSFFKRTLILSLLGHITVFSVFSLSFGNRIPLKADSLLVFFWGQLLSNSQVLPQIQFIGKKRLSNKEFLTRISEAEAQDTIDKGLLYFSRNYLKPTLSTVLNKEKEILIRKSYLPQFSLQRKESTIIFHPLLPYNFALYFKDRQIAHVELMFNIVTRKERNSIIIKRRISSGNLEVDLLVMRYIGHYLFIQKTKFPPNTWQTVKIDLSAKND